MRRQTKFANICEVSSSFPPSCDNSGDRNFAATLHSVKKPTETLYQPHPAEQRFSSVAGAEKGPEEEHPDREVSCANGRARFPRRWRWAAVVAPGGRGDATAPLPCPEDGHSQSPPRHKPWRAEPPRGFRAHAPDGRPAPSRTRIRCHAWNSSAGGPP